MLNAEKLHAELVAAGVPIFGVNSDGLVNFDPSATPAQQATAAAVVAAHNPSSTRGQQLAALGLDPRIAAHMLVVKLGAAAPKWAQDLVTQTVQQLAGL